MVCFLSHTFIKSFKYHTFFSSFFKEGNIKIMCMSKFSTINAFSRNEQLLYTEIEEMTYLYIASASCKDSKQ